MFNSDIGIFIDSKISVEVFNCNLSVISTEKAEEQKQMVYVHLGAT